MQPVLRHQGQNLYVDLTPLVEAAIEQTEMTAASNSGTATLTVRDIEGFAINQILLIGELGYEGSEIIKTHGSTAPTGTTITLVGNLQYTHAAGTKVYRINYDQIEFSRATTSGGSKSVLATQDIQVDELTHVYFDTNTSGYYYARFKETVGNTFSPYTDEVPYGGLGQTTVAKAIEWALKRNGLSSLDNEITFEFCVEEINDFLHEWQGSQMRWPEHQNLNADIGTLVSGTPLYTLPTDIYDNTSNKSILGVRVGSGRDLRYYDPLEFERWKVGENRTQVATQAVATDTTLVVDNAGDFDDGPGVLSFYVSGTLYHVTYTAVNKSTNTFSGIPATGDGAFTVTVPVDTYIYQGASFGIPTTYTIRGGYVELDPIPDDRYDGVNLYGDYWTVANEVNSQSDTIDVTRYDAAKYYLAWKIKMQKKNDGSLDIEDGFYQQYRARLAQAVRNKPNHIKFKSYPRIFRNLTD